MSGPPGGWFTVGSEWEGTRVEDGDRAGGAGVDGRRSAGRRGGAGPRPAGTEATVTGLSGAVRRGRATAASASREISCSAQASAGEGERDP